MPMENMTMQAGGESMEVVNIYQAKTHFSKLIDEVINGKEIVIAKAGKPVARLAPLKKKPERKLGLLKGQFEIADDFDDPLPEDILRAFKVV